MIPVDASVWIDHLLRSDPRMSSLLAEREVLQHPFVTGELACDHLCGRRDELLPALAVLPRAPVIPQRRVLRLLEEEHLFGIGLSWIDVHLLASTQASRTRLWTRDRELERAASRLGIAA